MVGTIRSFFSITNRRKLLAMTGKFAGFKPLFCRLLLVILLCGCLGPTLCSAANDRGPLQLTLPKEFYAVVGQPMSIYYDNIVLAENSEPYRFTITCDIGKPEKRRWTVTPQATDTGDHHLTVSVTDAQGKMLGKASTMLRVTPADAGTGQKIRLLIVGDSLTHGTLYPNEIARLLSLPGNPAWKMLGTHRPKSAASGVSHEGYGGWTWQRFVEKYEPNPDGTYRKRSSPFVYLGADDKPALNVERYLAKECQGQPPHYVIFFLGINDCFRLDPKDPDQGIEAMFQHADTLIKAFRQAAPQAELAVCLTTPANARESGFEANYKGRYPRWGWKRIQHRLVQLQLKKFAEGEKENIFLLPTQLNIDTVAGYPDNNAVHPNKFGYHQIAGSMYAWLKTRMQAQTK